MEVEAWLAIIGALVLVLGTAIGVLWAKVIRLQAEKGDLEAYADELEDEAWELALGDRIPPRGGSGTAPPRCRLETQAQSKCHACGRPDCHMPTTEATGIGRP